MTLKNKDFSLPRNLSGQKDFHFPTQHTEQESKYGSEEQEGPQASPKHTERLQLVNFFFLLSALVTVVLRFHLRKTINQSKTVKFQGFGFFKK